MVNEIDALVERINKWNKENVRDLQEMIWDLSELLEDDEYLTIDDLLNLPDLPSVDIPQDVDTTYPIWAMDRQNRCLVGYDAFDHRLKSNHTIEPLDEIREYYASKN